MVEIEEFEHKKDVKQLFQKTVNVISEFQICYPRIIKDLSKHNN